MIVRSASYSSGESSQSITNIFGSSSSCCSLQQLTSQQQRSSTGDLSFSNNNKQVKQSHSIPSSVLAMGKELVCKCLQSTYSIQVVSSSTDSTSDRSNPSNPISNPWLKLTVILLVSMKLHLLFEHSVCLISLVATRYLAGKKRERHAMHVGTDKGGTDSRVPLVRTASSFCDSTASSSCPRQMQASCSSPNDEQSQEITYEFDVDDIKRCTPSSKLPPSANELSDSQHSNASTSASQSQTWSQRDLEVLSGPPSVTHSIAAGKESRSSSFLSAPMDAVTDEWGQFTDFDDDYQNESVCGEGTSTTSPTRGASIGEDPFRSISKAILKRRGDKLSVCKLGQLQEEENEDDFD